MKLGELMSLSRELKKMTLRDLEKKTGVSNALICQIESGKVKDPGFRTVCKLAAALGLSLKRLAETDP
jgi:transcriptional regulator with XRE-family HTH domain